MAASSRAEVLRIYRVLLRESQRFAAYGYRTYAIRRIRDAFRENKHIKDSAEIQKLVNKAKENLDIIHRQMSCNQKEKDDFVTALNETLSVILSNERTILVVDVNTYISRYCGEFNKVRRRCGYGQKNGGDTSLQHSSPLVKCIPHRSLLLKIQKIHS
ncbi:LYR motif-containing protein 4 isoform X1 [Alligator mississippiensis]|uniref:LYR motif-containing protein 4 isoform X1 n=1 Tax=Alligator mississippiensis TaxID=8496 RepID=UPI0028781235|nr:LYR motif-containing protein 4 isoform X1 [Alligator mississippiensis]